VDDSIYKSLSKKCFDQRKKYQEWHMLAHSGISGLKQQMEATLGISGRRWKGPDSPMEREYVEVASLRNPDNHSPADIIDNDITDSGELPFALIVRLEAGERLYPKVGFRLPVAIRIRNGLVEYAPWDANKCQASPSSWTSQEATVNTLIQSLDMHLEFDPLNGPPQKTGMGFIQLDE
jgi:hypothetical protein